MNGILAAWTVAAGLLGQSPDTPQWHTDYGAALAATKRADRPLLVVIDDPSRPDHRIEQASTGTTGTRAELLSAYELCHIDATTGYGRQVAEAFKVRQYPYTAIIDRTGSVILHQRSGQYTSQDWVTTLARYKSGVYHVELTAGATSTTNTVNTTRSRGRMCVG
jgi:hypothetical protein